MEALSALTSLLILLVVLAVTVVVLFAPAIVAYKRKHKNKVAILVCTVVGFFTAGIGWVIAMVWACTDNTEKV